MIAPQVKRFLQEHPEANFSLTVDNTQTLLRSLESGRLDFVLLEGFFDRSRYDATLYRKEPFSEYVRQNIILQAERWL